MNPKVDAFIREAKHWNDELTESRNIVLECGLIEEFKWRQPCYSYQDTNILILSGFKNYFAISFFKGALFNDPKKILIQPTKNMQAVRHLRFNNVQEIILNTEIIKGFINQAIEVEKAGLKVELKKTADFEIPTELEEVFAENPDFKKAFEVLTPGRQRGYLLHFSGAKQSKSRIARIEKNVKRIFNGKGLNDCVCGLSNRMPNCDGSHKQLEKTD